MTDEIPENQPRIKEEEDTRLPQEENIADFQVLIEKAREKGRMNLERLVGGVKKLINTDTQRNAGEKATTQRDRFRDDVTNINVNIDAYPEALRSIVKSFYGIVASPEKSLEKTKNQLKDILDKLIEYDHGVTSTLFGRGYNTSGSKRELSGLHKKLQETKIDFDMVARSYVGSQKEEEELS